MSQLSHDIWVRIYDSLHFSGINFDQISIPVLPFPEIFISGIEYLKVLPGGISYKGFLEIISQAQVHLSRIPAGLPFDWKTIPKYESYGINFYQNSIPALSFSEIDYPKVLSGEINYQGFLETISHLSHIPAWLAERAGELPFDWKSMQRYGSYGMDFCKNSIPALSFSGIDYPKVLSSEINYQGFLETISHLSRIPVWLAEQAGGLPFDWKSMQRYGSYGMNFCQNSIPALSFSGIDYLKVLSGKINYQGFLETISHLSRIPAWLAEQAGGLPFDWKSMQRSILDQIYKFCFENWTLKKLIFIVTGGAITILIFPQIIGFGLRGPVAGSFAAVWQASIGNVPTRSLFACLQSFGMRPRTHIIAGALIGTGAYFLFFAK